MSYARTRKQWREDRTVALPFRPKRAKRVKVRAIKTKWRVYLLDRQRIEVAAFTKGEARAMVKQQLGLPRLPVGTVIMKKE